VDGADPHAARQFQHAAEQPPRGLEVVALRRAAEQETDPELKEKLWKEYEDYKRNSRG
jgi:hypothetical protein